MTNNTQTSAVSTPTRISVEPTRWDLHSRKSPRSPNESKWDVHSLSTARRPGASHAYKRQGGSSPGVEMTAQRAGAPVASVQVTPPDLYAIRRKSFLRQC